MNREYILNKLKKVLDLIEQSFVKDNYIIERYYNYLSCSYFFKDSIYTELCIYIRKNYVKDNLNKREINYLIQNLSKRLISDKHIKLNNLKAPEISNIDIIFSAEISRKNITNDFLELCYEEKINFNTILNYLTKEEAKEFLRTKIKDLYILKKIVDNANDKKECLGNYLFYITSYYKEQINYFISYNELIKLLPSNYIFKLFNSFNHHDIKIIKKLFFKNKRKKEYTFFKLIYLIKKNKYNECIANKTVLSQVIEIIIKNKILKKEKTVECIKYFYNNNLLSISHIINVIAHGLLDINILKYLCISYKDIKLHNDTKKLLESNYIKLEYKIEIIEKLEYLNNKKYINDIFNISNISNEYKIKILKNKKYFTIIDGKVLLNFIRNLGNDYQSAYKFMSSKKVFQKIIDKLFNYGFSTNEINSRFNMLRLLLKHNKYLYKTINFIIFEKEFYKLDFKILEYITRYKEVGDKICDIYLNHHDKLLIFILSNININVIFNKKLFNKILAFFDNNNLIIRKIENNINKIEFNTLMEYIYRNSSSYGVYRTLNYKDQIDKSLIIEIIDNHVILDNKYNKLRHQYCNKLFEKNRNNLYMQKNIYFNIFYNLTIEEAFEFYRLFKNYKDNLKRNIYYNYIKNIEEVINIYDFKSMREKYYFEKKYYTNSFNVKCFNYCLDELMNNISKKVLKIKDCKKINKVLNINGKILIKDVYIPNKEFMMLVHSTDAYGNFNFPSTNYNISWKNSCIRKDYLSCSVISNKYMGVCHIRDVLLGFSHLLPNSLSYMAPYDLHSNNYSYYASTLRPANFMNIEKLIDNSRHTHNEILLERYNYIKNMILLPDYVIIFSNFSKDQTLKAIKCSEDMNIPIVYIDIRKFLHYEKKKYLRMRKKDLRTAINDYECNRNGLRELDSTLIEKYFSSREMNKYINKKSKRDKALIKDILIEEENKFNTAMEATNRINFLDIKISDDNNVKSNILNISYDYMNLSSFGIVMNSNIYNYYQNYIKELLKRVSEDYIGRNLKHGINHIERVMLYSFLIGYSEKIYRNDILKILKAAAYHDIARKNDSNDKNHGYNSALLYLNKSKKNNDDFIIAVLIAYHEVKDDFQLFKNIAKNFNIKDLNMINRIYKLANILKDADALDRLRFHNPYAILNPKYLREKVSKNIIPIAQKILK